MRRREFLGLVCGTVAAWPNAARAQQTMPLIGFFNSGVPAVQTNNVAGFRQGLKEAGLIEGQNVAIEFLWAERLPVLAADQIKRPVAVIVGNTVAMLHVKATGTTIPIVFTTGSDPVK